MNLENLLAEFKKQLAATSKEAEVLELKSHYLGKKGKVSEILRGLKDVSPQERQRTGPAANQMKAEMLLMCDQKLTELEAASINTQLAQNRIDIELTENRIVGAESHGGFHPRSLVQREIENIFLSMGFEILDGPHIEDEYHNFEALNIPPDHPARDTHDTFWFDPPGENSLLLRTHTSTIQVRGMQNRKPPFRFIAPGLVFRCERTDASHEMVFSQVEGMMVGEDISTANLIYFMSTLLSEIFKQEVEVRLRPGYFPFVEPGFELDIACLICKSDGCSVCKQSGWVELLPCGMVHPNVLKHGGIDPSKWSGFAFGLGLDRLVMMKYKIDDIRHLAGGDLRFSSQFKSY